MLAAMKISKLARFIILDMPEIGPESSSKLEDL